jgi:hypothetical protein
VPFSFHDVEAIGHLLARAGFEEVRHDVVSKTGTSPSATEAAHGLIDGNPVGAEIASRRPDALAEIKTAVASNIGARLGAAPVRCSMRAIVFTARRPAG